MRILGIDPGLATVGIGLIEAHSPQKIEPIEWLTIETKPGLTLPERLCELCNDLKGYLTESAPDLAVVEKIYFSKNEKTALDVAQARGALLSTLGTQGIPILEPSPSELKACITGDGRADKQQIQDMLSAMFQLSAPPRPDDAADALALAVFGALQKHNIVLA